MTDPVFAMPNEGRHLPSISVRHRLTGDQTGGAYYLFESVFEPGVANRLHVHHDAIEVGYVLEGALEVRLGEDRRVLEAGGVAHLPIGIPHALRNPLETSSRYLFLAIPGGLDAYFEALEAAIRSGSLDEELDRALSRDHAIEWLE